MDIFTIQDRSFYYWLKDLFSDAPFIKVVDAFPDADLEIPSISISSEDIDSSPFELGSSKRLYLRSWNIDVFAKNETQRSEMSYRILRALENNIPVYNFALGFPTETVPPFTYPSQLGCLLPLDTRYKAIKIYPELVTKLFYRGNISVQTEYSVF